MINKFKLDSARNIETKEAITRTLEIANNYAGELSIEVLPLNKIELDPGNNRELLLTLHDAINGIDSQDKDYERKKQDWKSLESLANTIRDDQLINPIYVYRYGNKCRLIAGERRTLASAIAGKKEIIARIANQRPIGTKLRILQWIENNERVDLSLAERIASLEAIIKEHCAENKNDYYKEKITAKVLSDLTGMSMTQARRYILILQAKPEIKQAIVSGKLENIKLIELICSIENVELQRELLNSAVSGVSFDAIAKLKKDLEVNYKKINKPKGRKKITVNLGKVKLETAKTIAEALAISAQLKANIVEQIQQINNSVHWNNSESVEKGFKRIILLLRDC